MSSEELFAALCPSISVQRLYPKTADFFQKIFFLNYYNIFKISKLEFLLDPELRGRSTGSMIRGTTAAVRLRRPSVT